MKPEESVELQSLLHELNQFFMIKWGQGKPEGKWGLPPLDSIELLC